MIIKGLLFSSLSFYAKLVFTNTEGELGNLVAVVQHTDFEKNMKGHKVEQNY